MWVLDSFLCSRKAEDLLENEQSAEMCGPRSLKTAPREQFKKYCNVCN